MSIAFLPGAVPICFPFQLSSQFASIRDRQTEKISSIDAGEGSINWVESRNPAPSREKQRPENTLDWDFSPSQGKWPSHRLNRDLTGKSGRWASHGQPWYTKYVWIWTKAVQIFMKQSIWFKISKYYQHEEAAHTCKAHIRGFSKNKMGADRKVLNFECATKAMRGPIHQSCSAQYWEQIPP